MAQADTPISPIDPRVEMFQKGHRRESLFNMRTLERPESVATEFTDSMDYDTEFEDDESDVGDNSPRLSLNSDGKRSETTLSSFEELQTPTSNHFYEFQFNVPDRKSVVGPRGPHLFRASTDSSMMSLDEQFALSMSPLPPTPITPRVPSRPQTALKVPPMPAIPADISHSHRPINTLSDAMTNFDKREVAVWTPAQVARWMFDAGFEPAIVEKFEENDISGAILITLKFEDLRELDIPSFGKRHKLWNEIHNLRGSLPTTPRPPTPIEAESPVAEQPKAVSRRGRTQECQGEEDVAPRRRKTSRRKQEDVIYLNRKHGDVISPLDSVSIVGIEQLVPKPHTCSKGEDCSKWRKQQRVIAAFKKEHPVSPEGGMIWIAGNPGNPQDAPPLRPFSDAIASVVASSDVLGPGTEPSIHHLEEESLRNVASRDPQDNVKQFLSFQHVAWPNQANQEPATPPYEMFPALSPTLPGSIQPHQGLRTLPKLAIPGPPPARSASANAFSPYRMDRAEAMSPALRNVTHSPINGNSVYRFGTPFSEMDVPVTAVNLGPVARDTSQSVPPNMSFRAPIKNSFSPTNSYNNFNQFQQNNITSLNRSNSISSATSQRESQYTGHARRPSLQIPPSLPPLHENSTVLSPDGVWSPVTHPYSPNFPKTGAASLFSSSSSKIAEDPNAPQHQGIMRKRRTKLLRHEWHEHHFTLRGTRLAMHSDSRAADTLSYIDIDDYAIACSSLSSSKLNAAFRALSFTQDKNKSSGKNHINEKDPGAFSFQLIPAAIDKGLKLRKRDLFGDDEKKKTHHFAVRSRDERIDWMRELMLAKALRRKGEGYEVNLNGNMI